MKYRIKLYEHISDRVFEEKDFKVLVNLIIQMRKMFGDENVKVVEVWRKCQSLI